MGHLICKAICNLVWLIAFSIISVLSVWPLFSKKCVDGFAVLQVLDTKVFQMVALTVHQKDEVKICTVR